MLKCDIFALLLLIAGIIMIYMGMGSDNDGAWIGWTLTGVASMFYAVLVFIEGEE